MTASIFGPQLQLVESAALKFCKDRYGRNGLRVHEEIDSSISWKPTFSLRVGAVTTFAVEVDEILDPVILKLAAHEISKYDKPIAVLLACPLSVYQADPKQKKIAELRRNGIGIITVDDGGTAMLQHSCVPLAQHISEEEISRLCSALPPSIKVAFKSAHATFLSNVGSGLQEAGQIVEAIVKSLGAESAKAGIVTKSSLGGAAETIDALYISEQLKDHRAALGGARSFAKEFRNTASHPAKTAKEVMDKINKCRLGFLEAIRCSEALIETLRAKGFRLKVHL